jgi:hypothetical protein
MRTARIAKLGLVLLLAGCASGGGAPAAGGSNSSRPRPRPDLITADEIATKGEGLQNALDIVQRLRPQMLRPRAASASTSDGGISGGAMYASIAVYVDEVMLGNTSNLSSVPALQIKEIRYISASDATTRWGTGYPNGVIQVITKR